MLEEFSHLASASYLTTSKKIKWQAIYARYFFAVMAVAFFAIALIGFVPGYKAMYAGTMKLFWFVHIH